MRMRIARWGAVGVLIASSGGVAVGVALTDDADGSVPLKGDVSTLSRVTETAPVPDGLATLAASSGEADVSSAQRVATSDGQELFLLRSLKAATRMCLAVTGSHVALTCVDAAAARTGRLIIPQPLGAGGKGAPRVDFGIVPNGVATATMAGRTVPVIGNAFAVRRPDGGPFGRIEYGLADGSRVDVDLG